MGKPGSVLEIELKTPILADMEAYDEKVHCCTYCHKMILPRVFHFHLGETTGRFITRHRFCCAECAYAYYYSRKHGHSPTCKVTGTPELRIIEEEETV